MPTHKAEGSKSYVTVNDAIEESGVSERTLRRWIADGKVHTVRDRTGHLRIDYDDVQAHARLRSDSPLRFQVHQLLARIEQLEQEVARLSQQIEEVRDLDARILQTLGDAQSAEDTPGASLLISEVAKLFTRARGGRAKQAPSPVEKRGLPTGTLRLKHFAELHRANLWEIKKLYWSGQIALEVKRRAKGAKRNQQEWWITPDQHRRLADYWREHGITYDACPQCQGATIQAS
jgi:excisionase family DNA binding protein